MEEAPKSPMTGNPMVKFAGGWKCPDSNLTYLDGTFDKAINPTDIETKGQESFEKSMDAPVEEVDEVVDVVEGEDKEDE